MAQQELNLETFKKIMGEERYLRSEGNWRNTNSEWKLLMSCNEITADIYQQRRLRRELEEANWFEKGKGRCVFIKNLF